MRLRDRAHPVLTAEGGAILDEHTGRWLHLTPTAASALRLLLETGTEQQAAETYAARYSLSAEHATRDLRAVTDQLTARGLTDDDRAPNSRRQDWRWSR